MACSFCVRQKEIRSDAYCKHLKKRICLFPLCITLQGVFFSFELLFLVSILTLSCIFDLDTILGTIFRELYISNFQICFLLTEFDSYNILPSPELAANK